MVKIFRLSEIVAFPPRLIIFQWHNPPPAFNITEPRTFFTNKVSSVQQRVRLNTCVSNNIWSLHGWNMEQKQNFHPNKLCWNCQCGNKRGSQEWLEPAGPRLLKLSGFYSGTHTVR